MNHPNIDQSITFIYCTNLAASSEFYETVLGLSLWRDQTTCRIYRLADEAFVGVCQSGEGAKGQAAEKTQDNVILTLVSSTVDAWYAQLTKKGITIPEAPRVNPRYNIYHFFLRDPDGYLIEIQQFLDAPNGPNG